MAAFASPVVGMIKLQQRLCEGQLSGRARAWAGGVLGRARGGNGLGAGLLVCAKGQDDGEWSTRRGAREAESQKGEPGEAQRVAAGAGVAGSGSARGSAAVKGTEMVAAGGNGLHLQSTKEGSEFRISDPRAGRRGQAVCRVCAQVQ